MNIRYKKELLDDLKKSDPKDELAGKDIDASFQLMDDVDSYFALHDDMTVSEDETARKNLSERLVKETDNMDPHYFDEQARTSDLGRGEVWSREVRQNMMNLRYDSFRHIYADQLSGDIAMQLQKEGKTYKEAHDIVGKHIDDQIVEAAAWASMQDPEEGRRRLLEAENYNPETPDAELPAYMEDKVSSAGFSMKSVNAARQNSETSRSSRRLPGGDYYTPGEDDVPHARPDEKNGMLNHIDDYDDSNSGNCSWFPAVDR